MDIRCMHLIQFLLSFSENTNGTKFDLDTYPEEGAPFTLKKLLNNMGWDLRPHK